MLGTLFSRHMRNATRVLMIVALVGCFSLMVTAGTAGTAQAPTAEASGGAATKPTEHVLGTISNTDSGAHTITVKDDKSGAEYVVSLANTRTLLKVTPGAKDLHTAIRISAEDLAVSDRVDVRGFKSEAPNSINAKSVVLMSARDLAQKHQTELQAWQNSTIGKVTAVDPGAHTIAITTRVAGTTSPATVQTSATTEFTRYSADDPKTAVHSQFGDIQPGDQIHVITPSTAGSSLVAEKIYSAPVRTMAATIISISADGKQITAKNLQTKQPETIQLTDAATIRKLPPQMAMFLAHRLNPSASGLPGAAGDHSGQPNGAGGGARPSSAGPGPAGSTAEGGPSAGQRGRGDLSHMMERVPSINAGDLKSGDAIVVWGFAGRDPSSVVASTVLAGVEPVLQSAPPRQGQSLDADWGLNVNVPAQ